MERKMVIMHKEDGVSLEWDTGQDRGTALDKKMFKRWTDDPRWTSREWVDYTKNTMGFGMETNDTAIIRISDQPQFRKYEFKDFVRPIGHRNALWEEKAISIDDARNLEMQFTDHKAKDCFIEYKKSADERSLTIKYVGPNAKDIGVIIYFAYDLYMREGGTSTNYYWIGPVIRNDGSGPGGGG